MIRGWIGVALLAASWLLGLGYYQPPNGPVWLVVVLVAAVLLSGDRATWGLSRFSRRNAGLSLILLLPVAWLVPWPYKAVPLLIALGLALQLLPIPRRWPGPLGRGAVAAGTVMLAQALAVSAYAHQTARSHELPWPLSALIVAIARALGVEAALSGSTMAIQATGRIHRLGATWDLLLDPATLCFFVGGLVLLGLAGWGTLPVGSRWPYWIRSARALSVAVVAWLPLRAALLMAFYLHRASRADPVLPLSAMDQFLSTWVHLLLQLGPVLLAARFVRRPEAEEGVTNGGDAAVPVGRQEPWRLPAALGLVALAVATVSAAALWTPVGRPKTGRVMVVERHSLWEPTIRPYDEESYGESASYTYRLIYDCCTRYYSMSRLLESERIDAETLGRCDVLVLKTPTARFSDDEVRAINKFVRRGGGLLLVGDHTNVFNSSTYLNDVARTFGFTFRNDLLFRVGTTYEQPYRRPWVPHPAVGQMGPMDFAVSCSIDPGRSRGRAAIRSTGLWSLPASYHTANYHPPAAYRAEMRYGAFIQLWATCHGKGRVLAFTDSTIFSNFCIFQPGKSELWLNMIQWLNHSSPLDKPATRLLVVIPTAAIGLALLVVGLWLARRNAGAWLALLAAGMLGWTVGCTAIGALHRHGMPRLDPARPMVQMVIDRAVSQAPLSKGAFIQGEGEGYGLLEQWIPRLGYFTTRRDGPKLFGGDALVVLCPTRSVSREYREQLVEYVAAGGKLLVVDSPDSIGSTANSLLWPFGLAVNHGAAREGELHLAGRPTGISVTACKLSGGQTMATLDDMPVATRTRFGDGRVMAIGFGAAFNDANMGTSWMELPDAKMRQRYDLLYKLLRELVDDSL